jgi:O6-methylguanine-DNA--protein-cysteine methyltransferase
VTYGERARQLGEPGAARAVGEALGATLRMLQIEKARFGGPGLFDD